MFLASRRRLPPSWEPLRGIKWTGRSRHRDRAEPPPQTEARATTHCHRRYDQQTEPPVIKTSPPIAAIPSAAMPRLRERRKSNETASEAAPPCKERRRNVRLSGKDGQTNIGLGLVVRVELPASCGQGLASV